MQIKDILRKDKIIPPVKVNDEIKVEVMSIGALGDPVAKVDTFTVFIKSPKGEPASLQVGDSCEVKIFRVAPHYACATLI